MPKRRQARQWPAWWGWQLEVSAHLEGRMIDRDFNEIELRTMLTNARSFRVDVVPGRWVIETSHLRRRWEIVVEPDGELELLVVVTAYPV